MNSRRYCVPQTWLLLCAAILASELTWKTALAALATGTAYSTSGGTTLTQTGAESAGLTNAAAGSLDGTGQARAGYGALSTEARLRLDQPSLEKIRVESTASFEDTFTITGRTGGGRFYLNFISTITTSNLVPGVARTIIAAAAPNSHYLADPIDNTTPLFDSVPKFFTFGQPFTLKAEIAAWVEIQPGSVGFVLSRLSSLLYSVEITTGTGVPVSSFQISSVSGTTYPNLPPPPALNLDLVPAGKLRVRWPLGAENYVLETAGALGGMWRRASLPMETVGTEFQLVDELTEPMRFYRLRLWPR